MSTQWQTLIKPAFLQDINRLPARDVHQIMEKVSVLTHDPHPVGNLKKHLTHCPGRPYRIRAGDYRIFYTYNQQYVCIYKIDRRAESTYKECPEAEDAPETDIMSGLEIAEDQSVTPPLSRPVAEYSPVQTENRPLPVPITRALLTTLEVPKRYHATLLQIKDEDALLTCSSVEQKVLMQILDYLFERPLVQVMEQPNLILNEVDDLLRYKNGELLTFLLKLSPEQEKYVKWPLSATGPTLVKGGPGTGKSTVALYRIRSLLQQLQQKGETAPRILFTTYTNALIKFSEQLLELLLGVEATKVQVATADTLATTILKHLNQEKGVRDTDEVKILLRQAIDDTPLEGNKVQQAMQSLILKKMGLEYLLQEITSVLIARQVGSLEEYKSLARAGRKLGLNGSQRELVWRIYERWLVLLHATGQEVWEQRRVRADALVEQTPFFASYDAVVIDEAQDLDPSALRMLVRLCKSSNRIFVTADANQAIYSSSFNWDDVHVSLKFPGRRTNVLHENYRSTREIGMAAHSYLASGVLEAETIETQYIASGPKPDVLAVQSRVHEAQLLANFFKSALRSQGLTLGSCAILCPNEPAGRGIVSALKKLNLEAIYMTGRDLDLNYPGIKVLTLNVAKGLEFPIVALAGFVSSLYPILAPDASVEEQTEILMRERRTMFVGMTRAMCALLVVVPVESKTPLLKGFDPRYWNTDRKI